MYLIPLRPSESPASSRESRNEIGTELIKAGGELLLKMPSVDIQSLYLLLNSSFVAGNKNDCYLLRVLKALFLPEMPFPPSQEWKEPIKPQITGD